MAWIFVRAFDAQGVLVKVALELFLGNAVGYFGGGVLEATIARASTMHLLNVSLDQNSLRVLAMLMWGLCYGLGFGLGLGLALYHCQAKARALLSVQAQSNSRPGS